MIPGLLLATSLAQASPTEAYARGLEAGRAGDNVAAAQAFTEALVEGGIDPAVYHALGNALWRQEERGLAIGAWSRGLRLEPNNADLVANLARARRENVDRLDPVQPSLGPFFWAASSSAAGQLLLAASALGLSFFALAWRAFRRRQGSSSAGGGLRFALLMGVLGLVLGGGAWTAARLPEAVVVRVDQAAARSALGPDGVDLFMVHEGAELEVVERAAGHVLASLPDGRKGWLPDEAVVSTDPSADFPAPGPTRAPGG